MKTIHYMVDGEPDWGVTMTDEQFQVGLLASRRLDATQSSVFDHLVEAGVPVNAEPGQPRRYPAAQAATAFLSQTWGGVKRLGVEIR